MWVCSLHNSVHNAFATIHLFRDCFSRNFKYRLVQREWDILTVRIVRYSPDQGYSATICQQANQNAPRVPLCFICRTHHWLDFISIGRWKWCASWCLTNEARRHPGSILVCFYGVLKYTSFCLTLNHLIIIGKYFLYINGVHDEKRPQFTDFVLLLTKKLN